MQKDSTPNGGSGLLELDKKQVWHPFTPLQGTDDPIVITKGEGVYLYTADGNRIIDAISSWWVNIHGHSNSVIADAIATQARTLEHVIFAGFTHEPAIRLSSNLLSILPRNQKRVFFSDNGSTAVEVALKMAFQYWHNLDRPRKTVIALNGAYHGDTFGAMSIGGRSAFSNAFEPFLFNVEFIDVPTRENIQSVTSTFKQLLKTDDVACFIYEPLVQGAAGMVMYEASLLNELIALAQEHDIICIADEVFTGFGRTGKHFASQHLQHMPDIMAVSKGITGGNLPLGVTTCSAKIESAYQQSDVMKTFFHGHSYTANPTACAAANASFQLLVREECQKQIEKISLLHSQFKEKIKSHTVVKEVRTCGTILAIELKTREGTSYFNSNRNFIYNYFLTKGILLRPLGNVFYVLPPYVITEDELKFIYQNIEDFLTVFAAQ